MKEERFTITLTEEEWKALKKELEAAERAVAMDRVLSTVLLLIKKRD